MTIQVRTVPWHDPTAATFREAMRAELRLHNSDHTSSADDGLSGMDVRPSTAAYAGIAYNRHDLPVGHAAMCWSRPGELELRMYVLPPYRGRGAALPLLAAAERAAADLGAVRILVRADSGPPDAMRLYQRHGYLPLPGHEAMPHTRFLSKAVSAHVAW